MENSAGFHLRRERVVSVGRTVPEGRAAMCTCALRHFGASCRACENDGAHP